MNRDAASAPRLDGLVTGRFEPLHRGHLRLLAAATQSCATLTIIVMDSPAGDAALPLALRARWLREACPHARVISAIRPMAVLHDTAAHAAALLALAGQPRFGVLFSADRGDLSLAGALGGELGLVERDSQSPTSAVVQADPLTSFDDLAAPARAHFARRILVIGDTARREALADLLARRFVTARTHAAGQAYADAIEAADGNWRSADFAAMAIAGAAAETRAARRADRLLICSGDILSVATDHREFLEVPAPELETLAAHSRYDLIILARAASLVSSADTRRDERLLSAYRAHGLDPLEVRGALPEQLAGAVALIADRLGLSAPALGQGWSDLGLAGDWLHLETRAHTWRRGLWVQGDPRSAGDLALALDLSGLSIDEAAPVLAATPDSLREADWYTAGHTSLMAAERRGDYDAVERLTRPAPPSDAPSSSTALAFLS